MVRVIFAFSLTLLSVLTTQSAQAQTPEDTVRWIYTSLLHPGPAENKGLSYLTAPAQRAQFLSRSMVGFYHANDSYGADLMAACVDFAFDIPGNDFDAAEIVRTLTLSTLTDATNTSVTAAFSTFGQPVQIIYDFIVEDGHWRIDDIAGPGFRASLIPCAAKASEPATPASSNGYCYKSGDDSLRLDVAQDGRAQFSLDSWQANGHSCGAHGTARPISGGWAYEDNLGGTACRINILVTPDQGLALSDVAGACRTYLCGARAGIDGMIFPRSSQVDCALMPKTQY